MHVCHVVESKCIFVWTILSQSIELTTMVTYNAGLISGLFLAGCIFTITNLVTHRKRNIQTLF